MCYGQGWTGGREAAVDTHEQTTTATVVCKCFEKAFNKNCFSSFELSYFWQQIIQSNYLCLDKTAHAAKRSLKELKNYFNLWNRSHDKATRVSIGWFLPEDFSVSQASEWIQLKTILFESPARISMYKSTPDVTAPLEEHTRCQGKSWDYLICFYQHIFGLMRNSVQSRLIQQKICYRGIFFFYVVEWECIIRCVHGVCYPLSLTV